MDRPAALEWAREELVRLIEIPSFSDEEHELVRYLEARLQQLDLPARRRPVEGSADNLVIAWDSPTDLLLTAHLDTIRPTWHWNGVAEVRNDVVYGLGAQDDKGGVVACLLSLLMARDRGVPIESLPIGVGLCVDEEVGGKGSIAMARELGPRLVVGTEGTELRLGLAEAGFAEFWVHVPGRSIHGALREDGENAIDRAIELVASIQVQPFARHEHPLCGRNIPMVWEIRGGRPLNVVPDACDVHVDIRVTPDGPTASEVLAACEALASGYGATVDVIEVSEPFETPAGAPLADALARAARAATGRRPSPTGMLAWTDAHNFVDLAGSQAVVFGPGHLRDAHRPDEHVDLAEVVDCAQTLANLIAGARELLDVGGTRTERSVSDGDRA